MRHTALDKSLADRVMQAMRADADLKFLHACPSPTGLSGQRFRGWCCEMACPVPSIEMQIGFRFDGAA